MINTLIEILKTLEVEVYQQGSFTSTSEYPDRFFTYWNDNTIGKNFYDNKETKTEWYFTIHYYAPDPAECLDMILKAKAELQKNGFIVSGKGMDVASDSNYHAGRMIEAIFLEK